MKQKLIAIRIYCFLCQRERTYAFLRQLSSDRCHANYAAIIVVDGKDGGLTTLLGGYIPFTWSYIKDILKYHDGSGERNDGGQAATNWKVCYTRSAHVR